MIKFLFAAASGLAFAKSELTEFALDALGYIGFSNRKFASLWMFEFFQLFFFFVVWAVSDSAF